MNYIRNKKGLIFIFLIFCILSSKSQIKETVLHFDCEIPIDNINNLIKQQNLPFEIVVDSVSPQKGSWFDCIIEHKSRDEKIEIYRMTGEANCILEICKINQNNQFYFRILITELLVGYDFFLLLQLSPFKLFKSEDYNFEQNEGYTFLDDSISKKKKTVKIKFFNSQEIKTIQMQEMPYK